MLSTQRFRRGRNSQLHHRPMGLSSTGHRVARKAIRKARTRLHLFSYAALTESTVMTGMPDWRADVWVKLAGMISMGIAAMVTPAVKDVLGREPRSIDQFAKDFAAVHKGG